MSVLNFLHWLLKNSGRSGSNILNSERPNDRKMKKETFQNSDSAKCTR